MRFWLLIAAMLMLVVPAHAEVEAVQCPPAPDGQSFDNFDIYDQSAAGKEYITADDDGWNLDSYHTNGHQLFIACHYKNGDTKLVEIPGNIDFCSEIGDNVICR